jgi:hypothetical protein
MAKRSSSSAIPKETSEDGNPAQSKILKITCDQNDSIELDDLHVFQGKLKDLTEENYRKLRREIEELGFSFPFFTWRHKDKIFILDGTHRYLTLKKMREDGWVIPNLPINAIHADTITEAKRKLMACSSKYAKFTPEGLDEFVADTGWDYKYIEEHFDIGIDLPDIEKDKLGKPTMSDKFLIPPFSVLNAREGWWQDRKRQWIALGIKSELGRGGQEVASYKSQERLDQFRQTKNR